jgi:hypothetical protein
VNFVGLFLRGSRDRTEQICRNFAFPDRRPGKHSVYNGRLSGFGHDNNGVDRIFHFLGEWGLMFVGIADPRWVFGASQNWVRGCFSLCSDVRRRPVANQIAGFFIYWSSAGYFHGPNSYDDHKLFGKPRGNRWD